MTICFLPSKYLQVHSKANMHTIVTNALKVLFVAQQNKQKKEELSLTRGVREDFTKAAMVQLD